MRNGREVGNHSAAGYIDSVMQMVHRILPALMILSLVLGTTIQVAWMGMMADMPGMASAVMDHEDMPGCEDCSAGQDRAKAMEMAGCQGGACIVLPGLLPASPASIHAAPASFAIAARTVVNGLSPPPDLRPPRSSSLA